MTETNYSCRKMIKTRMKIPVKTNTDLMYNSLTNNQTEAHQKHTKTKNKERSCYNWLPTLLNYKGTVNAGLRGFNLVMWSEESPGKLREPKITAFPLLL